MTSLNTTQEFIEVMSYSDAASNSRKQLNNRIDNNEEFYLNYGQDAVKEILPVAEEYIQSLFNLRNQHNKIFFWNYVKPQQELYMMDRKATWNAVERASELVSVLLVSNLSKGTTLANVATEVSTNAMKMFNVEFGIRQELTPRFVQFFVPMIQHIAEHTDIFTIEQVDNRECRLFVSEVWEERITRAQDNFGLNVSKYKPMIVKPIPHTDLLSGEGGYLKTESPLLKRPVRIEGKIHPALKNFNIHTNPDFFNEINKAQETPYCVNVKLLEVVTSFYQNGQYFTDFPIDTDVAEAASNAAKEIDQRNMRRKKYAEFIGEEYTPLKKTTVTKIYSKFNNKEVEKARKTRALFEEADFYAGFPEVYFPGFVDYRGRRYPYANTGLTYQGDELAKALLQFARKEPFTEDGLVALYETLGNTLGHDKKICEIKEVLGRRFFDTHKEAFMNDDYSYFIDNQEEIDEPINALAIVMELVEYTKDPEYASGYIAHRDARCSGASIIGTILRDKRVMEMTSVIDWADDNGKLGDAYLAAANVAEKMCEVLAKDGNELAAGLMEHADVLFSRNTFKYVVMCK